jgi:methyl-accepting chemotaxis protein
VDDPPKAIGQALVGGFVTLAIAAFGYHTPSEFAAHAEQTLVASTALRNHLEANMMHDALRADVLSMLLADGEAEQHAVRDDLKDHSENFRGRLADNARLEIEGDVRSAIEGSVEIERLLGRFRVDGGKPSSVGRI